MDRQTLMFDADDTLWENNVLFERVVDRYLDWLAHPTLDRSAICAVLDDVERATIPVHGYGSASFLHSLHGVFEKLSERPASSARSTRRTSRTISAASTSWRRSGCRPTARSSLSRA